MSTELLEEVLEKLNRINKELADMKAITVTSGDMDQVKEKVTEISNQTKNQPEQETRLNEEVLNALFD